METEKGIELLEKVLHYFLPSLLLEHFKITQIEEQVDAKINKKHLYIELEEINVIPLGYDRTQYESKGFYNVKLIQDFPIRGKAVYLAIKRRRWRNKEDDKEIHNDYSFIADGSKLTQELSDFLKGTCRDPRRYN